jgi:hypothetical protein
MLVGILSKGDPVNKDAACTDVRKSKVMASDLERWWRIGRRTLSIGLTIPVASILNSHQLPAKTTYKLVLGRAAYLIKSNC